MIGLLTWIACQGERASEIEGVWLNTERLTVESPNTLTCVEYARRLDLSAERYTLTIDLFEELGADDCTTGAEPPGEYRQSQVDTGTWMLVEGSGWERPRDLVLLRTARTVSVNGGEPEESIPVVLESIMPFAEGTSGDDRWILLWGLGVFWEAR